MQDSCLVFAKCTTGSKIVLDTPDGTQVTWVMWNLVLVCLEALLVLVQDRYTVCAKCAIGSEITLSHPMVLRGDEALVDAHFGPFGDSANLDTK
jgi:hypothetical protein